VKFFIDECLSPALARRLNDLGFDAFHPLDVGRRGELDHTVLNRCVDEDRILVTENARDFRGLVGRVDMHPGLIILPSISRQGTLRLLDVVLQFLEHQPNPRDYMFNRVIEMSEDGTTRDYNLPR
jgi:predicted nuclease of predicted toxin-antitoxin system